MPVYTQAELARQMLQQLRVLDPSVSGEIGTPERKIIDTVAQALADAQIDLVALQGALDLDSKFGSNLDKFLALFGFARQRAVAATGFVTFSRTTASNSDIVIPQGTEIATAFSNETDYSAVFITTTQVTLSAGELSVAAPVRAASPGIAGNVAANTITAFVGNFTLGVTDVTNELPTSGGLSAESDDEFKLRFRNTVFRNVSGTEDQFLALAVSTAFTTKANVVGPISRYREYVQIPDEDDSLNGGGGLSTEWTTALSTIPYSKYIYDTVPAFVSNGARGISTRFFTQDLDFVVNTSASVKNRGDAKRLFADDPVANPDPAASPYQPNVTFYNVVPASTSAEVEAIREGDIVLFEHSYMSSESRNDFAANVTNCVDVFIDGGNATNGTAIITRPSTTGPKFSASSTDRLFIDNFRRVGKPETKPTANNLFSTLPFKPLLSLPEFIQVGDYIYLEGEHYWAVQETTELRGTIRARDGIEWSATLAGKASGDADGGPYTGPIITSNAETVLTVTNYVFDKNVIDLQAALEGAKQVTTDVLAHRATTKYYKLDVTVMYADGYTAEQVNLDVQAALRTFFGGQYFGTTIQLSDLLQIIHNVPGIDNVRWSRDVDDTKDRVVECDVDGNILSTPNPLNSDFYLKDNELPALPDSGISGDTLAGLIIRPRAQNTWTAS